MRLKRLKLSKWPKLRLLHPMPRKPTLNVYGLANRLMFLRMSVCRVSALRSLARALRVMA